MANIFSEAHRACSLSETHQEAIDSLRGTRDDGGGGETPPKSDGIVISLVDNDRCGVRARAPACLRRHFATPPPRPKLGASTPTWPTPRWPRRMLRAGSRAHAPVAPAARALARPCVRSSWRQWTLGLRGAASGADCEDGGRMSPRCPAALRRQRPALGERTRRRDDPPPPKGAKPHRPECRGGGPRPGGRTMQTAWERSPVQTRSVAWRALALTNANRSSTSANEGGVARARARQHRGAPPATKWIDARCGGDAVTRGEWHAQVVATRSRLSNFWRASDRRSETPKAAMASDAGTRKREARGSALKGAGSRPSPTAPSTDEGNLLVIARWTLPANLCPPPVNAPRDHAHQASTVDALKARAATCSTTHPASTLIGAQGIGSQVTPTRELPQVIVPVATSRLRPTPWPPTPCRTTGTGRLQAGTS